MDEESIISAVREYFAKQAGDLILVHRVLRDGDLVYDADHGACVAFEMAARREYLDLLPILRRYRQAA